MDKRFQVFVSSTYADLRDERDRVLKELTKIGYIAAGMEQFPSTDEDKFEYIQRVIEESDYYVVIIKGKYGSVDKTDGLSFTEKEFNYAVSINRPSIAFVYHDRSSLLVSDTDGDPQRTIKLNEFIARLEEKKIVNRWRTADELIHLVKDSVNDLARRKPGVGWIRGDKAIDPRIINDLESMRRERDELKDALSKVGNLKNDDESVFDEEVLLRGIADGSPIELKASVRELIGWLSEVLYLNTREKGVITALGVLAGQRNPELTESVAIDENDVRLLRYKLDAAGLINVSSEIEETVSGMRKFLFWSITAKSKKLLGSSKVIV